MKHSWQPKDSAPVSYNYFGVPVWPESRRYHYLGICDAAEAKKMQKAQKKKLARPDKKSTVTPGRPVAE